MNLILCDERVGVAGYAIVQANGSVLVAFGCLFDMMNAPTPDPAGDIIKALLIDETRTTVTLQTKKMHVVRREPDMLVAIESLKETSRHPVACSAHSIAGNAVLLVAYEPGDAHTAVPQVLCALSSVT